MTAPLAAPRSLAQKILRETTRFAALQAFASILAWGAQTLLARLLSRTDFGVYAICTFWILVGTSVGDGGLAATLLRRKDGVRPEEYRVAFTGLLAAGVALGIALVIGAPFIAAHWQLAPANVRVLRAMSPLFVVNALRAVPYIRLERELRFAEIARIELISSLVRHTLAIAVAFRHGGVWALVVSFGVQSVLQTVLAYRASPGWVGLGWSWQVFRPLVAFGSQVQALQFAALLKDSVSAALLGSLKGPAFVGLFDFGQKYIQLPVLAVNSLSRVQLPVYARLDARDPTLHAALQGAMRTALIFGIPTLSALALLSRWIIPIVYGASWLDSEPVIWGFLGNMVGGLLASPLFTLLQGQGRPGLAVGIFAGWTVATWALAIAALLLVPNPIGWVALAYSAVTIVVVTILVGWARAHLGRSLFRGLVGPVVAGAVGLATALWLPQRTHVAWCMHSLSRAVGCVVVYFAVLFALEGARMRDELRTVWQSARPERQPAAS